ncbi:MAG: PAS domain-containing sensor histidine kinase [Ignavibacteria bacterium]|nr:PAS domain-containing sensor histidine kinase [Ignavibacteria bacterium]
MNGIFVNKEFLKIAGLTVDDIVGVSAYTTAERNNLLSTLLHDIAQSSSENNQSINRTLTISYDKKELYFEKEIIPLSLIPSGESSPVHGGYVCILRNITAYRELDIAKTHLIATLSHEFKTPIASIRMSLQLLHHEKTGTISPKQRELLESIDEDTRRLLTLVGEVLTMAQVESGNIHLSLYPSSVQDIIDYALTAIMAQARKKNIECVVKYPALLLPPSNGGQRKDCMGSGQFIV